MHIIKPLRFLLLLPAIIGCLMPSTASQLRDKNSYQLAIQAKERGNLTQAINLLRQAIHATPSHAEARFQLGLLLIDMKRWREAEEEFHRFVQLRPDSLEGHTNLAAIYAQLGMADSLARELKSIVRLKPEYAQGHSNLSDYHLTLAIRSLWRAYKNSDPENRPAIASRLEKLYSVNPGQAESYFIRGNLAQLNGDKSLAREMFQKAAEVNPGYQPARLLEEARRLAQEGESDDALENISALSVMGASSYDSDLMAADILTGKKQYKAALEYLDKISSSSNVDLKFYSLMANALKATGQAGRAVPFLEKAVAQQDRPDLRRQLAEAYKANGDYTKAVSEYEKLLKTESDRTAVKQEIMELTREKLLAAETTNAPRSMEGGRSPAPVRLPDALMLLPALARCLVVEKDTQTLLVFLNTGTGFELEKTFACSTGARGGEKVEQGDEKTPEGIYLFKKVLPGSQLPEIYGKMAITLDYPNPFDRLEGKSGDGIWLHATNETIRPYLPNKSRGCVVVSNKDIQELSKLVKLNETPLVIVSKIRYQTQSEKDSDVSSLRSFLSDWRHNWESKLLDPYISMYSSKFQNGGQDIKAWRSYKDSVFSRAGKIQLRTDLESIVRHEKYVILTLRQDYRSQRLTSKGVKRLFLARENGAWKIIAEVMKDSQ